MLSEPPANGPGLLWAEIKWQILLVLVNFPQCSFLLLGNHCQILSNRQPYHLNFGELVGCTPSDLSNTEQSQQTSFGLLPQLVNLDAIIELTRFFCGCGCASCVVTLLKHVKHTSHTCAN